MMRSQAVVFAAAFVSLLGGCTATSTALSDAAAPPPTTPHAAAHDAGPPAAGALPCEVSRILAARCQSCHQRPPQFGAPMPLVSWADTQTMAPGGSTEVWRSMKAKLAAGLMPPAGAPGGALTDSEKSTLVGWLDAGAPSDDSGAACASNGPPSPAAPTGPDTLPCKPQYEFRAHGDGTTPFAVPNASETYQCFSFPAPFTAAEQAIAFAPVVDNTRVVHHFILYGHTGTTMPEGCGDPNRVFLIGWAPGGGNVVMPSDVGLELPEPGSWLTLEVHYNNRAGYSDARDRSGVAVCTTTQPRPNEAGVITLGSIGIAIPPGADDYTVDSLIPGSLTRILPQALHVLWTAPHMHLAGKSFHTDVVHGGVARALVDVPAWDFGNQRGFSRDPATTLITPGDDVHTVCTYHNTTNATVRFGEKTENEMCFNFVAVYPIAGVPVRQWVTR
jgi:cytochrome c5